MALSFGLEVVKFFPAEAFGGLKTLKAISAPYGMIKFLPTGGINASNVNDYLSFSKVLACGGSWMVKDQLIKNGNFDEITRLTREAVNIMLGFDLAHIGIMHLILVIQMSENCAILIFRRRRSIKLYWNLLKL